jgi:hypothetical protein
MSTRQESKAGGLKIALGDPYRVGPFLRDTQHADHPDLCPFGYLAGLPAKAICRRHAVAAVDY